jgi:hypothetical protein
MDFIELVTFYGEDFEQTVKPDFEGLTTTWRQLGRYLHAEKTPLQSALPEEYWLKFAAVLQQSAENLAMVLAQPFLNISFTDEGNRLIEQYAKGLMTKDEVVKELMTRWALLFEGVTQYIP